MSDESHWLDRDLLEQPDLWHQATVATMPRFLATYTLHDSFLRQVHIRPNFEVVLIIGFDLVWNTRIPPGFDVLLVSFTNTYRISYSNGIPCGATIGSAESHVLDPSERERLFHQATQDARRDQPDEVTAYLFDEQLTSTVIDDVFWGRTQILHGPDVRFLVLNEAGVVFTSLEVTSASE